MLKGSEKALRSLQKKKKIKFSKYRNIELGII